MNYEGTDIYCDVIIPRKIDIRIVDETDRILAYYHTKPHWEHHVVIVVKNHVDSLLELSDDLALELLGVVNSVASKVKSEYGACRVLTNLGEYQDSKHLHVHVSSGEVVKK